MPFSGLTATRRSPTGCSGKNLGEIERFFSLIWMTDHWVHSIDALDNPLHGAILWPRPEPACGAREGGGHDWRAVVAGTFYEGIAGRLGTQVMHLLTPEATRGGHRGCGAARRIRVFRTGSGRCLRADSMARQLGDSGTEYRRRACLSFIMTSASGRPPWVWYRAELGRSNVKPFHRHEGRLSFAHARERLRSRCSFPFLQSRGEALLLRADLSLYRHGDTVSLEVGQAIAAGIRQDGEAGCVRFEHGHEPLRVPDRSCGQGSEGA